MKENFGVLPLRGSTGDTLTKAHSGTSLQRELSLKRGAFRMSKILVNQTYLESIVIFLMQDFF